MEGAPPAGSTVEEDVCVPEESAIGNVFTEIQLLLETAPDSQLLQVLSSRIFQSINGGASEEDSNHIWYFPYYLTFRHKPEH